MTTAVALVPADLAAAHAARLAAGHTGYLRDHAAALGTSELALLLATRADALRWTDTPDAAALFGALKAAGPLKTMTRNDSVVLERAGSIEQLHVDAMHLQVVGADIDLRGFPRAWGAAVALEETTPRGVRRSLQLFDHAGTSVFKAYLDDANDDAAWRAIRAAIGSPAPLDALPRVATPTPAATEPPAGFDVDGFRAQWDALGDTHDFHRLLRGAGIGRRAAMMVAGPERAERLVIDAAEHVLQAARAAEFPVMLFVGNAGMIQIHHGVPRRFSDAAGWFNILDPGMNLHLRRERIESAWLVRKPTRTGVVSSLELYDDTGRDVLLVHAERTETTPGDAPAWRGILSAVPRA